MPVAAMTRHGENKRHLRHRIGARGVSPDVKLTHLDTSGAEGHRSRGRNSRNVRPVGFAIVTGHRRELSRKTPPGPPDQPGPGGRLATTPSIAVRAAGRIRDLKK